VIRLYQNLQRNPAGRVLGRQLLRSATSIGANAHEAQAGQSRADFIAKISIAHKEARESAYWLRLLTESRILDPGKLDNLVDETDQIIRMLSSILLTAKQSRTRNGSTTALTTNPRTDNVH
jgi:four helix bundle protein